MAGSRSGAQEGYRISEVAFSGNSVFGDDVLSEQLQFPPVGWFARTFTSEEPSLFSADNLTKEAETLLRFYQTEGFLRASVVPAISASDHDERTVELLFTIAEGDSVLVGRVGVDLVNTSGGPLSRDSLVAMMRRGMTLLQGKRFRDALVSADQSTLLRALNDNGCPSSTVDYSVTLSENQDTASVSWTIATGPFSSFGDYTIEGTDNFDEDLIKDRVRFSRGDMYRQSDLEATQSDIYDLGLYRTVSIKALLGEESPERIPILISVTEASRYRLQMGVGYGRDEKFRISGSLDILGILGTAGQVKLEVKRSALEPLTLFVSYVHPDFILPKARFSVKPFLRREDEPGYEARRAGYEMSLAKPLWDRFYGSIGYSYEFVDLYRVPDVPLPAAYRSSYPKEAVIVTIGYASARPLFTPVEGVSAALSSTYSGLNLVKSDEYEFTRFLLDLRHYLTLNSWTVMATRVKIGSIRSRDETGFIPFEERFYAGGSVSIRGWSRSTLGPLDPAGKPTGGSSLLETGIELRLPYENTLHGVLFLDAGTVWETPLTYQLQDLGYAVGAGVRYATPIGPLRFDVAVPVFRGSEPVQWWFSIGHAY
jgi:outer membrane protein insertion porin family